MRSLVLVLAILVGLTTLVASACFSAACEPSPVKPNQAASSRGSLDHDGMNHGSIEHGPSGHMSAALGMVCDRVLSASSLAQKAVQPSAETILFALAAVIALVAAPLVPRPVLSALTPVTERGLAPPGDLRGVRLLI